MVPLADGCLEGFYVAVMVPDDLPDLLRHLGRILVEMYDHDVVLLCLELEAFLANLSDGHVHYEMVTEGGNNHRFVPTFSPEPEHRLPHPLRETVSQYRNLLRELGCLNALYGDLQERLSGRPLS